jgi:hypothetical protein
MEQSALSRVLEDWDLGTMELRAGFAGGRTAKRLTQAFTDFLIEALRAV